MIKVLVSALLLACLSGTPVWAQSKIFVSATGNDANDGSRVSPKRSFQAAHTSVADGGNIVVLDTAGYGALNITKSVAITVPPGVNGFVTVSGATAVVVNAGATGVVSLQGLIIEGSSGIGAGVDIRSAKSVTIEDTQIRNFLTGIDTGNLTGSSALEVRRSSVQQANKGIVLITPQNALLRANILDTSVQDTSTAFSVGRGVYAFLTRNEVTRSGTGLYAGVYASATVDACKFSHNAYAFQVDGGTIYTLSNNAVAYNDHYVYGASDLTPISPH